MDDLIIKLDNGEVYSLPVDIVAYHRAKAYAHEFGSLEESLKEDTYPLFKGSRYDIKDWLANNMNWSMIKDHVKIVKVDTQDDYNELFSTAQIS